LKRYDLAPVFTEDEFTHWFMPRPNIIDCYVVEKPAGGTANGTTPGKLI
jgi:glycylpeptide N-tetradecanoyltransferase